MEQTNELSENERAIASELNETNEICEMSEQLVSMLWDEAEIIWSEVDGSISYTTKYHSKTFLPIKDNQGFFFFWQAGSWVGGDTGGIFLFELKYSVMGFRNTGFN